MPPASEEHTEEHAADRRAAGTDGKERGLRPLREAAGGDGEVQEGAGRLPQA